MKKLFLPRLKAWAAGALAAAGASVTQYLATGGKFTLLDAVRAAVVGVLAFAGTHKTPNTTIEAAKGPTPEQPMNGNGHIIIR